MLAMAVMAIALAGCPTPRETVETAPNRFPNLSDEQRDLVESAQDAIDDGDCAAAWDGLWNAFRNGEPVAATMLATFIVFDGLVPPGSSPDRLSQERHATILALHGMASGTVYSRQIVDTLFETPDEPGSFTECLNENPEQSNVCIDEAIFFRFLPNRSSYVAETEALARAVAQPAICTPQAVLRTAVP